MTGDQPEQSGQTVSRRMLLGSTVIASAVAATAGFTGGYVSSGHDTNTMVVEVLQGNIIHNHYVTVTK